MDEGNCNPNSDIKTRIATYVHDLLDALPATQAELAKMLGISQSRLSNYLRAKELPRADVLLRLAELGGITVDRLLREDARLSQAEKEHISIQGRDQSTVITAIRGDVFHNTTVLRRYKYQPAADHIDPSQARALKDLVDEIVRREVEVKSKPKSYGAIWNALNRKMGVTYYREIKKDQYGAALGYLQSWRGRLTRGLKYRTTNEDSYRKARYKAIFARARTQLGWSKEQVHDFVYDRYKKSSLTTLTKDELEQLYNIIWSWRK